MQTRENLQQTTGDIQQGVSVIDENAGATVDARLYDLAMDAVAISNLALAVAIRANGLHDDAAVVAERAAELHDALMETWLTEDDIEGVA